MPELYGQAYNRYQAEGEALYNEALVYETLRQQAYAEHQDETSRWYQDQDYLTTMQAQDREYMNLLLSMGYEPSDEELSRAGMTRDQATILTDYYESIRNPDATATGSYSTGSNTTKKRIDNHTCSDEVVKYAQAYVGVEEDGLWGEQSQQAGGDIEDVVEEMLKLGKTKEAMDFFNSKDSEATWKSRGVGRGSYEAMVRNWLEGTDFSTEEILWLATQFGLLTV